MNTFLTAHWKNLIMVNYEADASILKPYLPKGTELDFWNGRCYISLVAFMFLHTKIKGFSIPYYKNFEEVNLRFYVRAKENHEWKRGVVFIKELVPKRMICAIANLFYNEHYCYAPIQNYLSQNNGILEVKYEWNYKNE